jgi:hypothetical protein
LEVGEIYYPPPFYRGNLGFPLSSPPHGRASARSRARADTRTHPRVHATPAGTRARVDVARPRGRGFYRVHV